MIISKRTPRISLRNAGSLGSLSCALVLCAAASLVAKDHGTKQATAAGQEHFRFEAVSDKSLKLWQGEQPVLVYNHGVITSHRACRKPRADRHIFIRSTALTERSLTDDFPKDHVNHRGLHWAWPHIKIGDQEVDLWSLRDIRHEFQRWLAQETNFERRSTGRREWVVRWRQKSVAGTSQGYSPSSFFSRSLH